MDIKKISSAIGTFLGKFIALFILAFISKITYDVIAYEFNLPTFNLWIHLGTIFVLHYTLRP